MNRDWFAQTQPETRGRLRVFLDWYPHVTVDLHEMGGDSTYYFAPPARPLQPPLLAARSRTGSRRSAARSPRASTRRARPYFVREVFDSFYPGYGESWPMAHGAVGMTFEQASARGLVWRREDGSTAHVPRRRPQPLPRRPRDGGDRGAGPGEAPPRLPRVPARGRARGRGGTGARVRAAARRRPRARRGGSSSCWPARASRCASPRPSCTRATARSRPGSYVVPLAQPAGRLVRNLLDPRVAMDEAFVKEQDRRRKKRLPDQIYDVTAWSLPLLFDVECDGVAAVPSRRHAPVRARDGRRAAVPCAPARVAWLLPWGSGTAAAVAEALAAGLKVRVAEEGFRLGGRDVARRHGDRARRARTPDDAAATLGAGRVAPRRRAGRPSTRASSRRECRSGASAFACCRSRASLLLVGPARRRARPRAGRAGCSSGASGSR